MIEKTTTRNIPPERACAILSIIKEFKGLPSSDLETIAKVCHWHRYEGGEEIVRYHDNSNSVFFITQGEMRVHYYSMSGQEVILCDLSAGEIFGELTAIDSRSRSATVVAKTSSLVASISGSVALSAKMHILDELACHPFKLDGFILPAHKIAQHKTSCQLPPSLSDLCESCALVRYQPRCF